MCAIPSLTLHRAGYPFSTEITSVSNVSAPNSDFYSPSISILFRIFAMWNPVSIAKLLPASLESEYRPHIFLIQRRCLCCRGHLSSPYLPAQVICPLLDSWRQRFLSFFECFSTLCATAQQPLVICHVHSSSSQASFDEKPERIEIRTVQFMLWPSVHLSQWLWLPKRGYQ